MNRSWFRQSLVALSLAAACAKATDEELVRSGDDDTGGKGGTGVGGSSGFGGVFPTGGTGKGGSATGGAVTGGASGSAGKGGTGGKGGTPGTGGSDVGGMGDGGEAPDPCSVSGTPPDLRVDYKADANKPATEDPAGIIHLVNATTRPIPLSELTVRYWFTSEFSCAQTTDRWRTNVTYFQLQNPYVGKQPADVTTRVVSLDTGEPGCDAYFELGFAASAGSLAAGQNTDLGYFAQIDIYNLPHNQSNDYSYGACTMQFVYWNKITVYRSGRLVTGSEPGGGGGAGGEGGMSGGGGGI